MNASITFPAAVACAIDGRPSCVHALDVCGERTKSIVTASGSPGTDSVAVSPASATSVSRCGRATVRTSSRASTEFAELDEPDPEPVLAGGCDAFDETRLDQRPELPRDGARRRAGAAGDLVRAERRLRSEHVEDRERRAASTRCVHVRVDRSWPRR